MNRNTSQTQNVYIPIYIYSQNRTSLCLKSLNCITLHKINHLQYFRLNKTNKTKLKLIEEFHQTPFLPLLSHSKPTWIYPQNDYLLRKMKNIRGIKQNNYSSFPTQIKIENSKPQFQTILENKSKGKWNTTHLMCPKSFTPAPSRHLPRFWFQPLSREP